MVKVGGEVDTLCNRCGMVLAHTVIAMVASRPVKVECNTCHVVHAFHAEGGAARRPARSRPARPRQSATSFDELIAGKVGTARRYSPKTGYAAGDVVDHPSFGLGLVTAVREGSKIEVTFRSAVKVLVHGQAGR